MTKMTCPNCQTRLHVTGLRVEVSADDRPEVVLPSAEEVGTLVGEMSGRHSFAEIRAAYDSRAAREGWPELTDKALALRLRASGAVPYRTKHERGWVF